MALERTLSYKVFRDGVFLGLLDNVVTSPFSYSQDINTGAAQTVIEAAVNPYVADLPPETLETEDGNPLESEASETLTTEHAQEVFGAGDGRALIRQNNDIEVWEYSDDHPNGVLAFSGFMSKLRGTFGNTVGVQVTCISNGTDLVDYIIESGQSTVASAVLEDTAITGAYWGFAIAQQIKPSADIALSQITLKMKVAAAEDVVVTPALYSGNPDLDTLDISGGVASLTLGAGNALIATMTSAHVTETSYTEKSFSLADDQTLSAAGNYYILFWFSQGEATDLSIRASNTLATIPIEKAYYARGTINNSSFSLDYDATKDSLYIKLIASTGNTTSPYTSQDPSAILTSVLDNYNAQGGEVSYSASSVDSTGLTASYTFVLATTLEGIQKCLDLAPYNFYWYVDPATGVLYFKQTATTADHVFVLGQHIDELSVEISTENVRNVLYFSGGPTAGVNLFKKYTNQSSITAQGRRRMERQSDNRVTAAATADILADSFLDAHAAEDYSSPLTIPDTVYDLSLINLGDVVGFGGFGNFIDHLLLQIVHIDKSPHKVTLTLGVLPKRAVGTLKSIERDLNDLQTIDNPSAPS